MERWLALLLLWLASAGFAQNLPDPADVTRLPPEIAEHLEQVVLADIRGEETRLQRLVDYMLNADGLGLVYSADYTRTVAETMRDRRGNCLSFTLAFLELARLAGLDARMHEAEQALILLNQEGSLIHAGHVNANVRVGPRRFQVDFDPNRPLVRGRESSVSAQRALAHYYNNRGAELMDLGELGAAQAHFEQARALDPTMNAARNNHGVLALRRQQYTLAEEHFEAVLLQAPGNVPALSNLVSLYRRLGDSERQSEVMLQLAAVRQDDPLQHFSMGLQYERQGAYAQALEHFHAAATLRRREVLFQQALARVYQTMGDLRQADRHQARADMLLDRRASRG